MQQPAPMEEETEKLSLADVLEEGRLEVTIDGLGYRGEGYVRLADGWLSVRGALPGESVLVDVQEPSGSPRRLWGDLVRIISAVERRSDPHCDRVSWCRGCQLRHLAMFDELAVKTQTVVECVEKYAELPVTEQPAVETITVTGATRADAFRVRTSLSVRHGAEGWEVGLKAHDRLVPMSDCPAVTDSVQRAVVRLEDALGQIEPQAGNAIRQVRIAAPVHGHGYVDLEVDRDSGWELLIHELDERLPPKFGLAVSPRGGERRHVRGPKRIRLPMADLRLEVGFDDWFHATLAPAEVLYDAILEWLHPGTGERLLDAGCGVGTIGLICAAAGADVVGFDVNPASVETAELNALANDLELRFECAGWERALRDLALAGETFDTVVINPMRDPLGHRALAYIPRLEANRVLYLGPSAAPAAKDLKTLRDLGFRIARLGAANLHPATYHVMLVAMLER